MEKLYENKKTEEHVILVGVNTGHEDTDSSLEELAELAKTAGASVDMTIVQNLPSFDKSTYVGSGKVLEIKEALEMTGATGIICDDELSPAQMKNLEDRLQTKVMDRTLLILDIFAAHATSREGKIQVELAQLKYRMTRLAGFGRSMSRLGGGIGTRGPGEKKLESDRRVIAGRITQLKEELKKVVSHRELTRKKRNREHTAVAAIVGYTNAGKSTLLNALTDAGVLSQDQLFATLDTTTRLLTLPGKQKILLTDTVGFIRKLPHHLVDAFRSTLEEAKYADYVIHVVDASDSEMEEKMQIVYETLDMLGVHGKKTITVFNKCDLLATQEKPLRDLKTDRSVRISAKKKQNLTQLLSTIEEFVREDHRFIRTTVPYENTGLIAEIRRDGELQKENYEAEGIYIEAFVSGALYNRLQNIIGKERNQTLEQEKE